ncbi:MAG: hypothetical protein ACYSU0_10665 [Planctomycetota bacterium]
MCQCQPAISNRGCSQNGSTRTMRPTVTRISTIATKMTLRRSLFLLNNDVAPTIPNIDINAQKKGSV